MRRQFLRVYLGLALVLVLAALAIVFFVERELRELVKHRTEEVMEPLVRHIRQPISPSVRTNPENSPPLSNPLIR